MERRVLRAARHMGHRMHIASDRERPAVFRVVYISDTSQGGLITDALDFALAD
jgi:hypothetical protein